MNALDYNCDLVAFDSVSRRSNQPVSDYVQAALERLEFVVERLEYEVAGERKVSLVAKKGSGAGGMAYFAHTDVVPADTWFSDEHGPFSPTVKNGKLYGRGSCDMKGSLACMLAAVEDLGVTALRAPVYITCTADEEIGYGGAAHVARESKLYREMVEGESRGIIGEPTQLDVVYAHKGTFGIVATSHGRAAHSSTREGVNANLAMIPFLAEMKRIHDETLTDPAWLSDEFDPPHISWNIGINDHTAAVNITPPKSVCTIYFRTMPGQDAEILIGRARAAAEAAGLEFEVRAKGTPLYVDPQSHFVSELLELAGAERPKTVSYGTDATQFSEMKHLAVFGPGDIAQAHTDDEWIDLRQLELGTEAYTRLVRAWCC